MSQWSGSLYIQVLDPKDWEKLYDIEIDKSYALWGETGKDVFGDVKGKEWYIEREWSPAPTSVFYLMDGLGGLFMAIRSRLQDRCVMYGSLVNINTDPYYQIFYSFGSSDYDSKEILLYEWDPDITDPEEWFKWANIKMTTPRIKHLLKFENRFEYLRNNIPAKRIPVYGNQQNRARMLISVKDPSVWKSIAAWDLSDSGFALPQSAKELFGDLQKYDFCIEHDWHIAYGIGANSPLIKLVSSLKKAFGTCEFSLFADVVDPESSPFYAYVCVFEGKIVKGEIFYDLSTVPITDINKWLQKADIRLSEKRAQFLMGFPSSLFNFSRGGHALSEPSKNEGENWMSGKIFVLTGFDDKDEKIMTRTIQSRGGIVKSSTVLNTDFVVFNPHYDHETTKLRRAKELISRGKEITIMTDTEFWSH